MILLKQLLIDCGVSQDVFAGITGTSRMMVSNALNRGILPRYEKKRNRFVGLTEAWITRSHTAVSWFEKNNKDLGEIWMHHETRQDDVRQRPVFDALLIGNPQKLDNRRDIEMILGSTMKHFKLFKNPFVNDVLNHRDIYLSAEHRFLKEMMLDSAKYGGFVAVVGGVGSGKSVMRKAVAEELINDGIKVVFPLIIDKARISPASLIDAIVMDISDEAPSRSLEQKTRQAVRLLKARSENGMRQVLMIEEAHCLDKLALKSLKQIHELETGFEKLMGIILIGQPELLKKLDEVGNADIREVIRRITTAEIEGLGKGVEPYLQLKFGRVGKKPEDLFESGVYDAINKRLERVAGRRVINRSFPLSVNNLVARAMNVAAQMGEAKITADMIMNC